MGLYCTSNTVCGPGGGTCDTTYSLCYNSNTQVTSCPCTNVNNGFCQSNNCYCYLGFDCYCNSGLYSTQFLI